MSEDAVAGEGARGGQPRVLFVSSTLDVGGAERQFSILVPALRRRGFDPAVLTLRGEGPFFDELVGQGIRARCAGMHSRFDLRGIARALAIAGGWPDLIVTLSLDAQLVGALIARRARVPHVSVLQKQPEITLALHRRLLMRLAARTVDKVIAVTEAQVPDLVKHGFPEGRIVVIPNGVLETAPTASRTAIRSELALPDDAFVALLVATLRPEKRADIFVRAVEEAARRNPRIRGIVAGDGPERAFVASQGGDAVSILGARRDIVDLIESCDVLCLTSSAEALPLVVIEAMAGGRAVVATDVGGTAEAVDDHVTGRVIAPQIGDELVEVLVELSESPLVVAAMGSAGRARYRERYSADRMADSYAAQFLELLRR